MKKIIALLDKEYPPSHSFVDGMLATELPKEIDIKVELIVSGSKSDGVCRYKKAACLPLLYPRKGIKRFLNFFKAVALLQKLIKKSRNEEIVLFVRNDPIYLLACSVVKQKNMKLIFQNSFPHENVSGHFLKRTIAKWMYKIGGRKVDSLLTVSPKGLERIQKILPHVQKGGYIPLLSDVSIERDNFELKDKDGRIKFIYIGDHSQPRKLEVVLQAIVKAYEKGMEAEFRFVGGNTNDLERLLAVDGVQKLEEMGILAFVPKIPREKIWNELMNADVGLSLIPPDKHYVEASPTKLTEYMGVGLAVIASYGIDLQEEFVQNSGAGILCYWSEDSIVECLASICSDANNLIAMKKSGYCYVKEKMNYREYVDVFRRLMQ